MESERPHANRLISELTDMLEGAGDDKDILTSLLSELEIRSSDATSTLVLLGRVQERMKGLDSKGSTLPFEASSEPSLPELIQAEYGVLPKTATARFNTPGWFGVGSTRATCPLCSEKNLPGFRKPYKAKNGDTYLYWALLCPVCARIFEPADLDPASRSLLSKDSQHRPGLENEPKVQKHLDTTQAVDPPQKDVTLPTSSGHTIECEGCLNELVLPELNGPSRLACPICEIEFDASENLKGKLETTFHHGGETLCLDFGTSSLRAALRSRQYPVAIALEIGEATNSTIDPASIPSTIFIPASGDVVLFGEEALVCGLRGDASLLFETSPKRWMSEGDADSLDHAPVKGLPISRKSLLAGLVAHALQAASDAAGLHHQRFRSIDIRVAHPVWEGQTKHALKKVLSEILAISVDIITEMGRKLSPREIEELCEENPGRLSGSRVDVVEPIAAGIELYANTENAREICAVVDVGAGTIDLALFLSLTPDAEVRDRNRSFISIASPRSLYMAGDVIDAELVALFGEKVGQKLSREALGEIDRGKRRIKETLFRHRSVVQGGVSVSLDELETRPRILEMSRRLREEFHKLVMEAAHRIIGWHDAPTHRVERIDVIFAGGGSDISFLHDAIDKMMRLGEHNSIPVHIRGITTTRDIKTLPATLERLAVSLGGTTPLDEWPRTEMTEPGIQRAYRL